MIQTADIILASGSPRRKELLTQAGLTFQVMTADVDETPTEREPTGIVKELSCRKAEAVAKMMEEQHPQSYWILAADTIVAMDGEILGKPKDEEDAVRMLRELSGKTHEVYTGVTLFQDAPRSFSVCTRVTFYELSEENIRDYVASGEPMDKAGAYGIQGLGARLVERIEGDYNNVVGLPLAEVLRILQKLGVVRYE